MFHSRFIVGHLNLLILVIQNRYLTPLGFIVNLFGERPSIPYNADTDAPLVEVRPGVVNKMYESFKESRPINA